MSEPKFPKLDWTKSPSLSLLHSLDRRPITLRLPLTDKPDESWHQHFKRAFSQSDIATMDMDCDAEEDALIIRCSALDYNLPLYIEHILQTAGIEWLNEQHKEKQWADARRSEFDNFKAAWGRRRNPLAQPAR